jgi:starch-binding outer membrane protein, SusD/RagB family
MENIMKKRYLIFSALILSVLMSCMDLNENPKSILSPGAYFNTPQEIEGVVAAMYRQLAKDGSWGFTSGFFPYFGSDDLAVHPASNKGDQRDFDKLSGTGTAGSNGGIGAMWNATWSGIYQANAIISNIGKVNFTSSPASIGTKEQVLGQAYFVRGMAYFYMVKTFGPVPIIDGVADADARPARSSIEEVYAFALKDLTNAEQSLPDSWGTQTEKATKWAAKAMLARVYMNMAGWPLKQTDKYALAATKAGEVIQSGKFTLVPKYADVFRTNFNSECVFGLGYNVAGGLPRRSTGQFCMPDDETSEAGQAGWHDYCTEINFFKRAPKCDRTDATFYTKIKKRGTRNADGSYNFIIKNWDDPTTTTQHPYFKKFRTGVGAEGLIDGVPGVIGDGCTETDTRIIQMNPSTAKSLDLIRYPGVLLDFAEATAMSSAPNAAAYKAVKDVRDRAGLPELTAGLGQTAFRDSVVFERAYEFAGEFGSRWFDIQRLQLLPQVIKDRLRGTYPADIATGWENQINPKVADGNGNIVDQAFLQTRYYAPIPDSEMSRNKQWKQNDGY